MDGFHHELSEDDMILSQVLETLEDEMELRNVNIEDFFGEFPNNVMLRTKTQRKPQNGQLMSMKTGRILKLDLSVQDINSILGKFALEVRKKNGEKYPAKTLYLLVTGLLRGIRSQGVSNLNLLNESDNRFLRFRQILDAQMKKLTSDGYGINVKQADPISVEQEDILWNKSVSGISEQMVMDRTGHGSEKAVRTYKRPADSMLKDVSNILNPSNKQIKLEDPKPLTESDTRAILPEQVNIENTENAFNVSKPEGKYRGLQSNSSFSKLCVQFCNEDVNLTDFFFNC
ncbi:Hypothetical predicted protein [Mytilus galloprovincialis]|uniref:DUF3504 domain-containing protein n=1 Tax=Mytilus galloprovincialis TaxID=29158 RepID=A0A8B6D743_MYTGA|nr:Hypothetical predicted protein [Mytilus galloprovincialis]